MTGRWLGFAMTSGAWEKPSSSSTLITGTCGMFYEPTHRYAYVEPVATDPAYRRMGLGNAAVLEGMRRCAELGAQTACVGSDIEFYQALGFTAVTNSECWIKYLD